jgi:2'-hydroxyisoflavone reductase
MLYGIRAVTTAETTFTWVGTDFLIERGVRPYSDLPVWRPPRMGPGFARFDLTTEVEKGFTFRPLATTAADTLEFHFSRPAEEQARVIPRFLTSEEEGDLLAAWHAR